nr:hypothetical protein [Heyndrickxia acidiproducens]
MDIQHTTKIEGASLANCRAHVRRYWLKADSKNGHAGVKYCDDLFRLERQFKHLSPGKRRIVKSNQD